MGRDITIRSRDVVEGLINPSLIDSKADTAALVASDDVEGGKLGARALAEKLGGKGTIVILQAHPDIDGVFAENDEMALGAIKALGDKAGKSVQVVGFDGTPDGLKAVGAGTLYASVAQQPRVPVKVVTKENVADFGG